MLQEAFLVFRTELRASYNSSARSLHPSHQFATFSNWSTGYAPSEVTMKSVLRLAPLFLAILFVPAAASAQRLMWTSIESDGYVTTVKVAAPESCEWLSTITGVPVSYVRSQENTQTLSDGTHLTHKSTIYFYYRDAAGRVRTENPLVLGRGSIRESQIEIARIEDPISGFQYIVDTQNHVAYRFPFKACSDPEERRATNSAGSTSGSPSKSLGFRDAIVIQHSHESLGTQVIEGVSAQGTRTTTVFPVGLFGNDRPITRTCEMWSPVDDLGNDLLSDCTDPRFGETVIRMTNISRTEPDPALFQVPAGYSVVDGQGDITLKFQLPPR
jgi:hypothetical protein